MTPARVSRTVVSDHEALAIESTRLRAVVIPSLGGRVWELHDRIQDRPWIWHRQDVGLAPSPLGSSYDDVWAGGWEELFPNDAPAEFEGRSLPDHGEWWTTAWNVAELSDGAEAVVRLVAESQVRRTRCEKEFRLKAESDTLHISYRIENREADAFHFLFKQHLPIALNPSCELVVPGGRVTAVDPSFGTLLRGPGPFDWPVASGEESDHVDLRRVRSHSDTAREFVYVTDLEESWCGVDDLDRGASLRMQFDRRQLPYLWLFLTYGGWRNCYTAVLEPCTNMPKDLSEAVRAGRSARLEAGGVFQTSVAVTVCAMRLED